MASAVEHLGSFGKRKLISLLMHIPFAMLGVISHHDLSYYFAVYCQCFWQVAYSLCVMLYRVVGINNVI